MELDTEVAQSGKQSLRMRRVAPAPEAPTPPDPKVVAAQWRGIAAHLEGRRAAYRANGAADHEIDWAIQNARVVLQGMQMRGNQVTRDHSMADNVKWILDHNPNAKIVLWAHNGHVAAGGFQYETMGAVLRRMVGKEMVVFGSAFNQGAFQAIPQGGGALKNFTVPPAPAGSLDATLSASEIPLFALDLRQAPEWFKDSRGSRQIGAIYPEDAPYAFVANLAAPEAFDVMLFIEKTTAARSTLCDVQGPITPC